MRKNNSGAAWRKWRATLLTLMTTGFLATFSIPSAAQCEADGDVQFVCGLISPEDLALIPDTPWVVVASWEDDGYLSAANADDQSSIRLFPTENPNVQHDTANYGACTGMIPENFRPHGISLRAGRDGSHTLYVVRHGAREAIEVFTIEAGSAAPTLTWIGCAVAPQGLGLNAVVALPDGGFGTTSPATGDIWEWHSERDWVRVPGSENIGPNGLEISPDGEWYYVAGYAAQSVLRLSRGMSAVQKETVANVGFNIDNIHWAPDGEIFAAGHSAPTSMRVGECIRRINCEGIVSHVAKVDPVSGKSREIFSYDSNEHLRLGTVAIQVSDELWIGSVAGSERIARIPAP